MNPTDLTSSISAPDNCDCDCDCEDLYALKCRACKKVNPILKESAQIIQTKNKRYIMKGTCSTCGRNLNVIISFKTYDQLSKVMNTQKDTTN